MTFKITDHIEFNAQGRAQCPSCLLDGKTKPNLALVPGTDGAYKCHRGCSPAEIRAALGSPTGEGSAPLPPPTATKDARPEKHYTQAEVESWHKSLLCGGPVANIALEWLLNRGIGPVAIERHLIGARRRNRPGGGGQTYAIVIPIPVPGKPGHYYRAERIAPWDETYEGKAWDKFGLRNTFWFTHKPEGAIATWVCAGEWDAIVLGEAVRDAGLDVAVATGTTGEGSIPEAGDRDRLIGDVKIFYDLDDVGEQSAIKLAQKIGDRARIATVPCGENPKKGWDVSDALWHLHPISAFLEAAKKAVPPPDAIAPTIPGISPAPASASPDKPKRPRLVERLIPNDLLLERAPDSVDYLIPELLPANEFFLLAAPPRGGKSLLSMGLARAVASGGRFLGRPCTQGPVIYVNLEDSEAKVKIRQMQQGWEANLPIYWLDDFKLSEMPELAEAIDVIQPALVVIDTLSRARDGAISETSAEMSHVLEPLQVAAKEKGTTILLVHHTRKIQADQAGGADPFDLIRGNSSIRGIARGAMLLAPGDGCTRLIVEHGHGKYDLSVNLNLATLTWNSLGSWKPAADQSQSDRVLAYLESAGSATCREIAAAMNIPERSCQTVLWRLANEDMISSTPGKGRTPSVWHRSPCPPVLTQIETSQTASNPYGESDTALCQQKNNSPDNKNLDQSDQCGDHWVIDHADHAPTPYAVVATEKAPQTQAQTGFHVSTVVSTSVNLGAQTGQNPTVSDQSDSDHPLITDPRSAPISDQSPISQGEVNQLFRLVAPGSKDDGRLCRRIQGSKRIQIVGSPFTRAMPSGARLEPLKD